MKKIEYTEQQLIDSLRKFYNINNKIPIALDMKASDGYIPKNTIIKYFKTWNNALKAAEFEINKRQEFLNGLEICYTCGDYSKHWNTDELGFRMCRKCYNKKDADFRNKNLDIKSKVGKGLFSEHLVVNVLKNNNSKHTNVENMNLHFSYDIEDDVYGNIDVKSASLSLYRNTYIWKFTLKDAKTCDTYVCLGYNEYYNYIEHVWIIPNRKRIKEISSFAITDKESSLSKYYKYEVDNKIYNVVLKEILCDNIKYFRNE